MSYVIPGYKLSMGTEVYAYQCSHTVILYKVCKINLLNYYIFDPHDRLYATETARWFWEKYPESHPHATLFEILSKKLDIMRH